MVRMRMDLDNERYSLGSSASSVRRRRCGGGPIPRVVYTITPPPPPAPSPTLDPPPHRYPHCEPHLEGAEPEPEPEPGEEEKKKKMPSPKRKGPSILPPAEVVPPRGIGPVSEPNANDVLSGRGGRINAHPGNVQFRDIVNGKRARYLSKATKKLEKAHIAAEIVTEIRSKDPPGRFLKEDPATGLWWDIGDMKARKKTGQALREDAPDFRTQLDEREGEGEGEGGSGGSEEGGGSGGGGGGDDTKPPPAPAAIAPGTRPAGPVVSPPGEAAEKPAAERRDPTGARAPAARGGRPAAVAAADAVAPPPPSSPDGRGHHPPSSPVGARGGGYPQQPPPPPPSGRHVSGRGLSGSGRGGAAAAAARGGRGGGGVASPPGGGERGYGGGGDHRGGFRLDGRGAPPSPPPSAYPHQQHQHQHHQHQHHQHQHQHHQHHHRVWPGVAASTRQPPPLDLWLAAGAPSPPDGWPAAVVAAAGGRLYQHHQQHQQQYHQHYEQPQHQQQEPYAHEQHVGGPMHAGQQYQRSHSQTGGLQGKMRGLIQRPFRALNLAAAKTFSPPTPQSGPQPSGGQQRPPPKEEAFGKPFIPTSATSNLSISGITTDPSPRVSSLTEPFMPGEGEGGDESDRAVIQRLRQRQFLEQDGHGPAQAGGGARSGSPGAPLKISDRTNKTSSSESRVSDLSMSLSVKLSGGGLVRSLSLPGLRASDLVSLGDVSNDALLQELQDPGGVAAPPPPGKPPADDTAEAKHGAVAETGAETGTAATPLESSGSSADDPRRRPNAREKSSSSKNSSGKSSVSALSEMSANAAVAAAAATRHPRRARTQTGTSSITDASMASVGDDTVRSSASSWIMRSMQSVGSDMNPWNEEASGVSRASVLSQLSVDSTLVALDLAHSGILPPLPQSQQDPILPPLPQSQQESSDTLDLDFFNMDVS